MTRMIIRTRVNLGLRPIKAIRHHGIFGFSSSVAATLPDIIQLICAYFHSFQAGLKSQSIEGHSTRPHGWAAISKVVSIENDLVSEAFWQALRNQALNEPTRPGDFQAQAQPSDCDRPQPIPRTRRPKETPPFGHKHAVRNSCQPDNSGNDNTTLTLCHPGSNSTTHPCRSISGR
jgi:hypothetical protein